MVSFGPTENNPLFDNIHMDLIQKYTYIAFRHNDDP